MGDCAQPDPESGNVGKELAIDLKAVQRAADTIRPYAHVTPVRLCHAI